MKKLRRFAAMMLAIIMATQNVAVACAETVESALNSDTAAVVEESVSSSKAARVFEDGGDSYTLSEDGIDISLAKGYINGQNLVIISSGETRLSFYPEAAEEILPEAEDESSEQEETSSLYENDAETAETEETPAAESPIPESPVAESPIPETPAPETPVQETPIPEALPVEAPEVENSELIEEIFDSEIPLSDKPYGGISGVNLGSTVIYPAAVNENIDTEFSLVENGLNEKITLNRYTTARLSHILGLENMTPVLSGNSVQLYNADGALAAEISAPYVFDAVGNIGAVTAELEAADNGWRLSYSMDADWLESAQFPVSVASSIKFNNITSSRPGLFRAKATCKHPNWVGPISSDNGNCYRKTWAKYVCGDCGAELMWEGDYVHAYQTTYTQVSRTQHEVRTACTICGSVSGTSYEAHADGNGDHVCDKCGFVYYPDPAAANLQVSAQGNGTNSRTGYLNLSWNTVSDATGYYVAIFNGEVYEYIYVGNVTSWSTKGKGIWPTEAEVSTGRYKLHTSGGGAELSVMPGLAYRNVSSAYAGDLNYYVSVIPASSAGYMNQPPANAIKTAKLPDTIPPSQASSVTIEPAGYTNADSVTLKWAGITDYNGSSGSAVSSLGSGGVQYRVDDQSAWTNTGVASGTGSCKLNIAGWEDGTHVVYLRAMDSAGNTNTPQYVSLNVDHTAPTAPNIELNPDGWSRFDSAKLTWSGISDLFDLSRVEYAFDGGAYTAASSSEKEYTDYVLDLSALSEGTHTLRVRAVDVAGNIGQDSTLTVKRDTVAPTAENITVSPAAWTAEDELALSWENLTDATSGVRSAWYSIDGGDKLPLGTDAALSSGIDISALADGKHELTLCFDDLADNIAAYKLPIFRDVTAPETALLSPADMGAVNGVVEIWGSVKDISLKRWEITATGSDGEARSLASGTDETDGGLMAMLNCAAYDDGEQVTLTLYAEDEAGNSSTVSVSVTALGKSAVPIEAGSELTYPVNRETITRPSINGTYSLKTQDSEAEGLLYIDGIYAGDCTGGSFPFDAVTYAEGSMHSISVLSKADSGGIAFSQGLSSLVLLSDIFEDESFLVSASGMTLGSGAVCSGSGELISQPIALAYPVLSLRLEVTEDIPSGSSIAYYYSTDDGATWAELDPGTDIPVRRPINSVQLRAELNGSPTLYGWTLHGVIETSPTRVLVKLLRPVDKFTLADSTVTEAVTRLADAPSNADALRLYRDGEKFADTFDFDVRTIPDGTESKIALLAKTEDNAIFGSGAETAILLRENVDKSGTIETAALYSGKPIHALRLEALSTGAGRYYYSVDREQWHELIPGEYALLDAAAEQVYVKAELGAASLTAWHIEGVSCAESTVTPELLQAPENVRAMAYGEEYYLNEKLRRYDLSWQDPNPADETAPYTTTYEVWRNGAPLATVDEPEYTDTDYIPSPWYEVYIVRSYEGYERRVSAPAMAGIKRMEAAAKPTGVSYTPQEEKQSEYLNSLYGGNYTFSAEPRIPDGDAIVLMSKLGMVDLCSYGLEPVNFNTGNFLLETLDGQWTDLDQTVTLQRSYNTQSRDENGLFGAKWASSLNEHLVLYTEGDVLYCSGLGAQLAFRYTGSGYSCAEDALYSLEAADGEYRVSCPDGTTHAFTGAGLLKYIESAKGSRTEYERDEDGLLTAIVLPSGKRLEITTNEDGHITKIATLGESALEFAYQGANLVSVTDANGGVTRYEYDARHRMTAWYDAEGNRQVKNYYDSEDRVIRQIDASGGDYALEYFDDHTVMTDADGNASETWFDEQRHTVKTVDATGAEISYTYDEAGRMSSKTDAAGLTTRYEYDADGNKTRETAPDGSSVSMVYDENGNLTLLTDQFGNVTHYEYDTNNNLTKQINPDGSVQSWTYNADKLLTSATDALGNVSRYEYDEGGNLISSTDPMGNVTRYEYDAEGRLIADIDALGNRTSYDYDSKGNLIKLTFADETYMLYAYDNMGNMVSQTDPSGAVTSYEYDALGNLLKTTYPDGTSTSSEYDQSGNQTSFTDALGNSSHSEYDAMGRLTKGTDERGGEYAYAYDKAGRIVTDTLPTGAQRRYGYDKTTGFLTAVTNEAGQKTTFVYDAMGRIVSQTAPNGGVTSYEYDNMGRLVSQTDPMGAETVYAYDLNGNILSLTDALGNVTRYEYDQNGNLVKTIDALGNETSYTYDALNRPVAVTDANGNVTRYEYDCVGNLVSTTDALGNTEKYAYDANGSIEALTDPEGNTVRYKYDSVGQVTAVKSKSGAVYTSEYDAAGNLISETDPNGATTYYEYDAGGLVIKITNALENETDIEYNALGSVIKANGASYTYDKAGRIISTVDAEGAETKYEYDKIGNLKYAIVNHSVVCYEYDANGNVTVMTTAEGQRIQFGYDILGNLTSLTYPDGSRDTYAYDALGRLISEQPHDGVETSYTYDALGNVVSVTEGEHTTRYTYDALSRPVSVTNPDGSVSAVEYDALGNVVGAVDALGNKTDYSYNAESLLTAVTYADGAKHAFVYDKVGNLTRETDETGGVTKYTYDLLGRVTEVKDALGSLTHYEYDPEGRLTGVTDANGNITAYAYDAVGRLVSETDPLGAETKYAYTPEGWLKAVTDANGNTTRYAYDLNGSIVSVNYAGEKKERNTYNELGLLTTVTTDEGVTEYQYDKRGYLSSVTEPDGDTVSYTYDTYGNRASMTYPDGETVKYTYDELNRLVKLSGLGETVRYGYNAKGQRIETRTDKLTTEYAYDVAGNLVSQSTTGAYDLAFEYDYDKSGRITRESRTENGATLTSDYAYDKLGQLTGFERSDGYTESYVYDPVGNMLSKTRNGVKIDYTYNAGNQLVSDGENKYTYDKNGNLVQKGSTKYTYNAQDLLESWTDGEHSESYSYNANRLLSSVTNDEGTTSFAWDILTGDGVVISAESGGDTTDYLYGLERIAALNGKNKTEYAYDGRGSVAAELRYTDAWYTLGGALSNADVTSKSYTPFGEQIGEAVSGFGYNGEYYNADTGMIYLRARFYEPEMNRFSQKDILWGDITVPNSLNSYAYVQNDPVNYCDPSGMRQVKGIDASGTSGSIHSVKKSTTSAAAVMSARAGTMAYMYSNEARMNGSAAAAKKAQQAIQQSYSYANEARMNGNGSSVYKTYGALQAAEKQVNYTSSRGSETVAEATPKVENINSKLGVCEKINGYLEEYFSPYSNRYGTIIGGLSITFESMFKSLEKAVKTAPRPANIGAGIFSKQKAAELAELSHMSTKFTKTLKVLSYGAALIDVGIGMYDNIKNGESALHIISDAVVDAGVTGGSVYAVAAIAGFAGATPAFIVSVGIYVLTDMIHWGGKSAREWIKTGIRSLTDFTANIYNDVKDDLTDLYYDAKYLFGF